MKWHSSIVVVLVFILLLITSAAVLSQTDQPATPRTLIEQEALRQVEAMLDGTVHGTILPGEITIIDGEAFGIVVVRALEGVHSSPQLILFTARQTGLTWEVALAYTPAFSEMLAAFEHEFMSPEAEAVYISPEIRAGNDEAQLAFPFATGETWGFNGPHQGPGFDTPRPALDLYKPVDNGLVRSAAPGTVWRSAACPNFVRIDHAGGWSTGYYHIINEAVTNGQVVARGVVVGTESVGVGCGGSASGDHVHFDVLKNGGSVDIQGHNLGGYIPQADSRAYEGCLIRISDNQLFCLGEQITSDGTIGAGSTDNVPLFMFNHHNLGWTGSNITHQGYQTTTGFTRWTITTADPQLTAPNFANSFSATTYKTVVVRMATLNDTCGKIYFRRSADANFDEARSKTFTMTADGVLRTYVIDMSTVANWNGSISQLRLDPGCSLNGNASNRTITLARVELGRVPPSNVELITQNNNFSSCGNGWNFGQDGFSYFCSSGRIELERFGNFIGFLAFYQDLGYSVLSGMPFEFKIQLGNTSASARSVSLSLRDPVSLSNALTCTFVIPAGQALTDYVVRGQAPVDWRELRYSIELLDSFTNGRIQMDNASARYLPSLNVSGTQCSDNWLQNGDFGDGSTGWGTAGGINFSVNSGVAQLNYGGVGSVLLQNTSTAQSLGGKIEASFDLGNSSTVRRRVAVLIHASDFSDLYVCSFWLPPNSPLQTYRMETYTNRAWTGTSISFYPVNTSGGGGALLLDNVILHPNSPSMPPVVNCHDPNAPAPPGGADSANFIANGNFASGVNNWGIFIAPGLSNFVHNNASNGVFEFYRSGTNADQAPSILQNTGNTTVAANAILELSFDLGNSSGQWMRVTPLLHSSDFSDLQACTFWLPPSTPLGTYTIRTYATQAWTSGASVSFYPASVFASDPGGRVRLDNVSMRRRPNLIITGTNCIMPGSAGLEDVVAMPATLTPEPTATALGMGSVNEQPLIATVTPAFIEPSDEGSISEGG